MPYKIERIKKTDKYKVVKIHSGEIKAKKTTLNKAKKQIKFLNYIDKK